MKKLLLILTLFAASTSEAQFAPAAGKAGSTAIKADSSCFVNWAIECAVKRGLAQINLADSGYASVGTANAAIGPALKNGVVSLGDGGSAVITFDPPIEDQEGFDFAIFENAFLDTFLEFAHVEVSNDKIHWIKFPSVSLTPTSKQVDPFGYTHPENISNLAGKYKMPYGVPFDLSELKDSQYYQTTFQYVRITDVVGSINPSLGSKDSKGNMINDPWPTPFASSGFDLDAVGVIHQSATTNKVQSLHKNLFCKYNRNTQTLTFAKPLNENIAIYSNTGSKLFQQKINGSELIVPQNLPEGIYYLQCSLGTFQFIK
jgi:hypothetical protein